MSESPRYRRDDRLPSQDVQGQTVVVVPARRELHELLEETANFLWAQLSRERSIADLVAALCDEFDVEPAVAEPDVREFLSRLEEKGLVIRS